MSSTWSLKLPNLLLKKIRGGSKDSSNSSSHSCLGLASHSNISSSPSRPLSVVEDQLTRDCKEFYERRVQLTAKAEDPSQLASSGPSSLCSSGYFSLPHSPEGQIEEPDPLASKILHLRKEFLSLIEVDNQLFKQLLNLNDAIQDFKELQSPGMLLPSQEEDEFLLSAANSPSSRVLRSKSFLEETKTFQRQRISFPATRRNRRSAASYEEEEDPNRMFYTLPSSSKAAKKKQQQQQKEESLREWRGSSSRSSASSASSSYERRSWKRYSETNNSLDSGIHADSSGESSDHYSP